MANNKTKKHTKKSQTKIMTIPQLRKAFEQLNVKTKHILSKHPINDESIKEFQTTWKQTFGKPLEHNTAETYLLQQSKQKTQLKKTRKQKGGMAPIDYTTRPGIDGSHGTFLPYISSGFKFYNDINNIGLAIFALSLSPTLTLIFVLATPLAISCADFLRVTS